MFASRLSLSCVALLAGFLLSLGCSRQETAQTTPTDSNPTSSTAVDSAGSEQVVSQFLDRIRRGGDLAEASMLLTDRARAELNRIGQPIQPIGSPDATFQITRSEAFPAQAGELPHRLVHCVWSEPAVDETGKLTGTKDEYQVVWSVAQQTDGWRIAGMVIEMSPNEPPMVLDFENGEAMAMILGSSTPEAQTAEKPTEPSTGF